MTVVVTAMTLLLMWLIGHEKPPYSKTYRQTRLDGTFSTSYEPRFQRYLDHVNDEIEARIQVGPISPRDDLHDPLDHPELPQNWQAALCPNLFRFHVKRMVAGILSILATLALADSVSRVLTNGKSVLHGFGTTGLGFRQLLALAFAVTVLMWLIRLRNSKMQTQGYLDGYSDGYLHVKSKRQAFSTAYVPATKKTDVPCCVDADELVAWMPALERGSPRFVNPWKEARQIVGAIQGVRGQLLDRDLYFILLADRFDRMLAGEDNPEHALQEIFRWLESEGLAETCPNSLEEAGSELIINNPFIQQRFYLMGIPGKLPRS